MSICYVNFYSNLTYILEQENENSDVVTAPLSKTQKRNLRRRLAVKRGDKPKYRLDLGKVPPSVCRKCLAYADRSVVKRTKQNESRYAESEDLIVPFFYGPSISK